MKTYFASTERGESSEISRLFMVEYTVYKRRELREGREN